MRKSARLDVGVENAEADQILLSLSNEPYQPVEFFGNILI